MISAMASHVNEELARLRALCDGTYEPPPTPRIDLNHAPLFAGLARAILHGPAVEIAPGTELRRTFAYVFAAPMVALSPPPNPRSPHPAPWYALEGGGDTETVEVAIARRSTPLRPAPAGRTAAHRFRHPAGLRSAWRLYRTGGGPRDRISADFLIGALALVAASLRAMCRPAPR
jgi:hypothetical protein